MLYKFIDANKIIIFSQAVALLSSEESYIYLSLDVILASGTFGAEVALVIGCTVVRSVFGKEPSLRQGIPAHLAFEALRVKVFILDSKHLTRTLFLTCLAICFTCKKNRTKKLFQITELAKFVICQTH